MSHPPMAQPRDDSRLTVEIKNRKPVELVDLTESFLSLGEEYKRFVSFSPEVSTAQQGVKLYIKEIRPGSIVADLVAMVAIGAPMALPYLENTNTLIQFASYLKKAYNYFSGKSEVRPDVSNPQDFTLLSKIIEPVAKDNGSQINITATDGGNVQITFNVNSTEANAAQNNIRREIAEFREPETRLHKQVVLYWHQARRDTESQVGDRAIIESIWRSPVKTVFESDKIKAEMILGNPNPFRSAYIVDVFVETINDKPALYKIIHVHERLDMSESSEVTPPTPRRVL